ncbi:MAG: FIST N-terminal domain-containing protein [Parachlamydiales bacterium]|jgi:hypothetical protein
MKIEQKKWSEAKGWQTTFSEFAQNDNADFVLAFGDRFILETEERFQELKHLYPNAHIALSSTSGNIVGLNIEDLSIIATSIVFEKDSHIEIQRININEVANSFEAGESVGNRLHKDGLKHIFLLSDGHLVNGTELVKGLLSTVPITTLVTGGLAGDGTRFEKTIVGVDAPPKVGEIIVVGFYGSHLRFGVGSMGGWDPFGIERKITKSSGNILYELDGKSALELYKKYLGDQSKDLPGSALLFPLAIRPNLTAEPLVRTILGINEEEQSMVFAGDVPEGWYAQLMKANFDRLVDGAIEAASLSYEMIGNESPELAVLISCVGRRNVLDQRTEEEIEGVRDVIGNAKIIGFYSYGEIAPTRMGTGCELHNQTMTITTISER